MKKIVFVTLFNVLIVSLSQGQTVLKYPHCNCQEKITYSTTEPKKPDGPYEWTCNDVVIETGQFKNGLKDGAWISKSKRGVIIGQIEYTDGKLNGAYELFHSDGTPKLVARFANGNPEGSWQYFNAKTKVIKTGSYKNGVPVGVWTIYDKFGKKVLMEYNFDQKSVAPETLAPYYKNNTMLHDDQSEEFVILYYPDRAPRAEVQPLGGFLLANDYFVEYMTIPAVMMDTYTNYNFQVSVAVEANVVKAIDVLFVDKMEYHPQMPSLPYIVSTNPSGKLQRIDHTVLNLKYLKGKIQEAMSIMGPWVGTSGKPVEIHIPFVLNDIKR